MLLLPEPRLLELFRGYEPSSHQTLLPLEAQDIGLSALSCQLYLARAHLYYLSALISVEWNVSYHVIHMASGTYLSKAFGVMPCNFSCQ